MRFLALPATSRFHILIIAIPSILKFTPFLIYGTHHDR